ncbi:MAG: hypothetical protein QXI22_09665, partial [Sulfolobales archaeon]
MSVERERRRGYRGGVKLYLGLLIVIFYAALGTYSMFAGYRTSVGLEWEADALAQPAWVALLLDPEIPRTVEASLSGWQLFQGGLERSRLIEGNGIVSIVIQTPGSVSLVSEYIDYPYKPARSMVITYGFKVFSEGSAKYRIQLYLVSDKLL